MTLNKKMASNSKAPDFNDLMDLLNDDNETEETGNKGNKKQTKKNQNKQNVLKRGFAKVPTKAFHRYRDVHSSKYNTNKYRLISVLFKVGEIIFFIVVTYIMTLSSHKL